MLWIYVNSSMEFCFQWDSKLRLSVGGGRWMQPRLHVKHSSESLLNQLSHQLAFRSAEFLLCFKQQTSGVCCFTLGHPAPHPNLPSPKLLLEAGRVILSCFHCDWSTLCSSTGTICCLPDSGACSSWEECSGIWAFHMGALRGREENFIK